MKNKVIKKDWFSSETILNLKKNTYKELNFSKQYNHYFSLLIRGVGFKVWSIGNILNFDLGYTHYISVVMPKTVFFIAKKSRIIFYSKDLQIVSNTVNELVNLKFPDSYKGKGIRFLNENIKLKIGKVKS